MATYESFLSGIAFGHEDWGTTLDNLHLVAVHGGTFVLPLDFFPNELLTLQGQLLPFQVPVPRALPSRHLRRRRRRVLRRCEGRVSA